MPERILDKVPTDFQLKPGSRRLRQELLTADPSLEFDHHQFEEVYGLILYNNYTAGIHSSPERLQIREMNKELAGAEIADNRCVDGRVSGKQQDENPIHTEPGAFIKRAPRIYRRAQNESGGRHIPRSSYLRVGIQRAAGSPRDLIEFIEGHYMEEPKKDGHGRHEGPFQPCGQVVAMQRKGEIEEKDLVKAHIGKIKEITMPAITDWYNDCLDMQGRNALPTVCLPLMQDTVTRGYVLDLDQRNSWSPLSVSELVRVNRNRMESRLGKLVGGYGSNAECLLDPEKIIDVDNMRYEIARGLMQDGELQSFRNDIFTYLSSHYADLTSQQRNGVLFKLANNAALLYLQGSAYGEAEHPYKWHNERCIVISPEGNPPFVYFPDVQSFIATPPEPERTRIYSNTMIDLWKHYREEARHGVADTRMPEAVLMFLATPVVGGLSAVNYHYLSALSSNAELFQSLMSDKTDMNHQQGEGLHKVTKFDLFKARALNPYSLLYNYQTRVIRAVVNNRAIANR